MKVRLAGKQGMMARNSASEGARRGTPFVVYGSTDESRALATVLSRLCGSTDCHDLSEIEEHVSKSRKPGRASCGKHETFILHDTRRYARPTRLIDTLYELRFSVGWLGPVLVVASPEAVYEIESTDLFRMSGEDHGPVPQKCLPSPLLLGALLNALGRLDGYGRFAWKRVKECVQDKDLIPLAQELGKHLIACIDGVRDMRRPLEQFRELLVERDGALQRFLPGHGHSAVIDRLLSRDCLCFGASDMPAELRQVIDALFALPKITGDRNG